MDDDTELDDLPDTDSDDIPDDIPDGGLRRCGPSAALSAVGVIQILAAVVLAPGWFLLLGISAMCGGPFGCGASGPALLIAGGFLLANAVAGVLLCATGGAGSTEATRNRRVTLAVAAALGLVVASAVVLSSG